MSFSEEIIILCYWKANNGLICVFNKKVRQGYQGYIIITTQLIPTLLSVALRDVQRLKKLPVTQ